MKSVHRPLAGQRRPKAASAPSQAQLAAAAELQEWQQNVKQRKQQDVPVNNAAATSNAVPQLTLHSIRSSVLSDLYPQLYGSAPSDKGGAALAVEECKECVPVALSNPANARQPAQNKRSSKVLADSVTLPVIPAAVQRQPVIPALTANDVTVTDHIQLPAILSRTHTELSAYSASVDYEALAQQQYQPRYGTLHHGKRRVPAGRVVEQPPLRFIDEKHYRARVHTKQPIMCDVADVRIENIVWQLGQIYTRRVHLINNSTHTLKLHAQIQSPTSILHCECVDVSSHTVASGMSCAFDITFRPHDLADYHNAIIFTGTHTVHGHSTRYHTTVPVQCIRSKPVLQFQHAAGSTLSLGTCMHHQSTHPAALTLENASNVPANLSLHVLQDSAATAPSIQLLSEPDLYMPPHSTSVLRFNVDTSGVLLEADTPYRTVECAIDLVVDNGTTMQYTISVTITRHSVTITSVDGVSASVCASYIDSGELCIHDTRQHRITVYNHSALPCTYHAILDDNTVYTVSPATATLAAHASVDVLLSCYSTTVQTAHSQLQLMYTDTSECIAQWSLQAQYVLPSVVMFPSHILCRPAYSHWSQRYTIHIHNENNVAWYCQLRVIDTTSEADVHVDIPSDVVSLAPHSSTAVDIIVHGGASRQASNVHLQCCVLDTAQQMTLRTHTIPISIQHDATLVCLYTDATVLDCGLVAANSVCEKRLLLQNPTNCKVEFNCECSEAAISIEASANSIEPHASIELIVKVNTQVGYNIDSDLHIKSALSSSTSVHIRASIVTIQLQIHANLDADVCIYRSIVSNEFSLTITNNSPIATTISTGGVLSFDARTQMLAKDHFKVIGLCNIQLEPYTRKRIPFYIASDVCGEYSLCVQLNASNACEPYALHIPHVSVQALTVCASEETITLQPTLLDAFEHDLTISSAGEPVICDVVILGQNEMCQIQGRRDLHHSMENKQVIRLLGQTQCPGVYYVLVLIHYAAKSSVELHKRMIYIPVTVRCTGNLLTLKANSTLGLIDNTLKLTAQATLQRLHIVNNSSATVLYMPYVYDSNDSATHFVAALQLRVSPTGSLTVNVSLHNKQHTGNKFPIRISSNNLLIEPLGTAALSVERACTVPRGTHAVVSGFIYMQSDNGWQAVDRSVGQQEFAVDIIV